MSTFTFRMFRFVTVYAGFIDYFFMHVNFVTAWYLVFPFLAQNILFYYAIDTKFMVLHI